MFTNMSLSKIITEYVKSQYPKAVHKGEIGRKCVNEWGYENENAGRRCRELVNVGILEAIYNEKHEVTYRYKNDLKNTEKRTELSNPPSVTPKGQGMFTLRDYDFSSKPYLPQRNL